MIRVCLKKEEKDLRLTLCGHAKYAPCGSDIVCAATSGLVYALIGYLVNLGKGNFRINALREGYADILCGEEYAEQLKLIAIGLIQLEATYPGHISVSESIWNWRIKKSA